MPNNDMHSFNSRNCAQANVPVDEPARGLRSGAPMRPWFIGILIVALGVLVQTSFASAEVHERRIALVIGNAEYQHVPQLENPGNDAQLMATTLSRLGFELIGGKSQLNLTRDAMLAAIRAFGEEVTENTVALIYYSGHGLQIEGTNYLVPIDADPQRAADADFELLPADLILKQVNHSGSGLNLVILDACRNNPFGGRGLKSAASGLAEMTIPRGTLISYATQPGGVARDGPPGQNSPYALSLAKTLVTPGLDILRTFNRVGVLVGKMTHQEQTPWVASSPIDGDYFLAGAPPAPASPEPGPAQSTTAANAQQQLALATPNLPHEEQAIGDLVARGEAAYDSKRYDEAMHWARLAADRGSAQAMADIGSLYQHGSGIPQDYPAAMRWYQQAADKGDASAANQVGWLFQQGMGVQQDYGEAMHWYRQAADRGSKEAENNIGYLFMRGWGVPQDYTEAMHWWRLSADNGHDIAMYNIGGLYERGWGTPQDHAQAMSWYRKAAGKGNALAMNQIGRLLQDGLGVQKDYSEAMNWYRRSVDRGIPAAMTNIGWLYQNGWGVSRNYPVALQWYRKAAEAGDTDGMNDLGVMFAAGLGVAKNCTTAREWFAKAAAKGNQTAQRWLVPNTVCNWDPAHGP
jgi:TPR repeat protein